MKRAILAASLLLSTSAAMAGDIDRIDQLVAEGQKSFRLFSEDMGAALSYKALAPGEPLGLLGIDVGIEVTSTTLVNDKIFDTVTGGSALSSLPVVKTHAHKGLPFGIDVGAFYSYVPASNIKLTGAELRYSIFEGGILMPAVAVRGTYTVLDGVDQLDLTTKGLELTISKGFLMLTPYAGIGRVQVTSTPVGVPGLKKEEFSMDKQFVGVNLNLGLLNFAAELDQTGEAKTAGLKIGFRF